MSPLTSRADILPDDRGTIRALESAIDALREQLALAEQRAAGKDAVIGQLHEEIRFLFRLLTQRRPWWRRWFR